MLVVSICCLIRNHCCPIHIFHVFLGLGIQESSHSAMSLYQLPWFWVDQIQSRFQVFKVSWPCQEASIHRLTLRLKTPESAESMLYISGDGPIFQTLSFFQSFNYLYMKSMSFNIHIWSFNTSLTHISLSIALSSYIYTKTYDTVHQTSRVSMVSLQPPGPQQPCSTATLRSS